MNYGRRISRRAKELLAEAGYLTGQHQPEELALGDFLRFYGSRRRK